MDVPEATGSIAVLSEGWPERVLQNEVRPVLRVSDMCSQLSTPS